LGDVANMLGRVEQLGRWWPRKDDPDAQWWRETLARIIRWHPRAAGLRVV
jgi:hypothetical protein